MLGLGIRGVQIAGGGKRRPPQGTPVLLLDFVTTSSEALDLDFVTETYLAPGADPSTGEASGIYQRWS